MDDYKIEDEDRDKSKEELIYELTQLRKRIVELETLNAERNKANITLQYRVGFERFVTGILAYFINFKLSDIDNGINRTLKEIGKFFGVDRSYVFMFDSDKSKASNTHEWCAKGIEPQIDNLQALPVEKFPWWTDKLRRLENIYIPRVLDLPPEADAEKEILKAQNIQSLIVVPMTYHESLVGFLGFDSVRKERVWSEDIIATLRLVGEMIASVLERKMVSDELIRSKEKYKTLFDSSQDAIMTLAPPDWKFTSANVYTIKLFKAKDEAEFLSKGPWEVSPEYQPDGELSSVKAKCMIEKAMNEGKNFFEWTHMKLNGEIFPANVLLSKIEVDGKQQVQATVRDISYLKQTQDAMLESESFMQGVFNAIQDGVSILKPDLTIYHVNAVMNKWYASNVPLEGKKCYQCYRNRDKPCNPCPTLRCLESGETEMDIIPGLLGSSVKWIELYSYPIKSLATGENVGVVEFVRNVTKRKRAEEDLKNKIYDLEIFRKAALDRETKMIELKQRIRDLEEKLTS